MEHGYPAKDLTGDFVRGGAGALLTLGPVLLLDTHWAVTVVLGGVGLLFLAFLLRTWQRRATVIELGPDGIAARGPMGGSIPWRQLDRLDLRYFSTRRDRSDGWLQLTLAGGGTTLKLESSLEGFDHVLERAADAARANGVLMTETTQQNLQTMGVGGSVDQEAGEAGPWTGNWAVRERERRDGGGAGR